MLHFPCAVVLRLQYFLHGFKQCGVALLKVSIKPFITMFDETEIRTMCRSRLMETLASGVPFRVTTFKSAKIARVK